MANNTKVDIAVFKNKLKNGEYETLTGARRAIGKVQGWTDKEKDSARAIAEKHFEGAPAPTKAKPGRKAKKAPKKAVKARAVLAKTPAAEESVAASPVGPGKGRKKKASAKTAPVKKAGRKAAATAPEAAGSMRATVETTAQAMGMLAEGTSILQKIKDYGSGVDVTAGLKQIALTATKLIEQLDRCIVDPLSAQAQEQRSAALFAQAAPVAPPATPGNAGYHPPTI